MTIQRSYGPQVIIGTQASIGPGPVILGSPPLIGGSHENPDAAPSPIFAGIALRDPRIVSRPDGIELVAGGYLNQDFCFPTWFGWTLDFAPAASSTTNIAPAHALTANTAIPLVTASGGDITLLTAPFTVPGTLNVIPAGSVRIGPNPSYYGYGTSGAIQGWAAAACDRSVSLTTSASISGVNLTVSGYDVYGYPRNQQVAGPASATTVNTLKGFKWVQSIVPSATNAATVSVGTANIFSFPMAADYLADVEIWWAGVLEIGNANGANGTFVAAVRTSPNTVLLGDTRGTYAPNASTGAVNGTNRLQIKQAIRAADVATQGGGGNAATVSGIFGVTSA